jgi:copper oxidase (laccase) domain-containing protein
VLAVVHCGWRGITAGIVTAVLGEVGGKGGAEAVTAAIGPGIGPCCYEVGDEVLAAFKAQQLEETIDGRRLDLRAAIRIELERGGVRAVTAVGLCTSCNPDLFFSHRRDGGVTGRQAGLAWLKK